MNHKVNKKPRKKANDISNQKWFKIISYINQFITYVIHFLLKLIIPQKGINNICIDFFMTRKSNSSKAKSY